MNRPGLFQWRILKEALTAILFGPYTSKFPATLPVIPDDFRGKPEFNQGECVGCGACFEVCPARAIELTDNREQKIRTLQHRQDVCIFCQQCELACITEKGIKLTKEWELSTTDRTQLKNSIVEKELVICEGCGATIGCLDHLRYLAKKVGPLLYANPTLLLMRQAELQLLEKDQLPDSPHNRAGHLKILCPNCRREMILKEQW